MSKKVKSGKEKKQKKISFFTQITAYPFSFGLFFIVGFIIYGQVLGFFPGKFDENLIILDNLKFLTDWGNLKEAFFRDAFFSLKGIEFYRPLQNLSFMLDANLSSYHGWAYYLSNLLIHCSTACGLYYLLNLMINDRKLNLSLSLFFLANPLFVHSVAWAPSRGDLLICFYGILSFIFFIKYNQNEKLLNLVLSIFFYLLTVLSKETGVILPVIFPFYFLISGNEIKPQIRKFVIPAIFYLFVAAFYFFLRSIVVHHAPSVKEFGLMSFFSNLRTIPEFITKFIIPVKLAPMAGYSLFNTAAGMILIIAIGFIIIKFTLNKDGELSSRQPLNNKFTFLLGGLWFLLFIAPGLFYTHELGSKAYDYLEQRAYLPMIGLIILFSGVLTEYKTSKKSFNIYPVLISLFLIYGVYSNIYSRNYENPLTFYELATSANPNSAMAVNNRGLIKHDLKDFQAAITDFQEAIRIYPQYAQAYVNAGISKKSMGDVQGALKDYETAVSIKPDLFQARFNIANIKLDAGMKKEALSDYEAAMKLNPTYYPGFVTLGSLKSQLGDNKGALLNLDEAIRLNPVYTEAFLNRGKVKYFLQDKTGACLDWQNATSLGSPEAENLLKQYCK